MLPHFSILYRSFRRQRWDRLNSVAPSIRRCRCSCVSAAPLRWTSSSCPDPVRVRNSSTSTQDGPQQPVTTTRLSKLLSQSAQNLTLSRREAERLIRMGEVTLAGKIVTLPHLLVNVDDIHLKVSGWIKVQGKAVQLGTMLMMNDDPSTSHQQLDDSSSSTTSMNNTRVWIAHKLAGEIVADSDPYNRPSLLQRLARGGVGKSSGGNKTARKFHLKPIGRLDMSTEGLILVTNNGDYAREMELPTNKLHRTYRVRSHGLLSDYKLARIRKGVTVDGVRYKPMKVQVDSTNKNLKSTNKWLTVTCSEGKNRQIRKVFAHLGLTITRLIRISYGDYQLQTIPPGMAIEVAMKPVEGQRHRGPLAPKRVHHNHKSESRRINKEVEQASPVQWVRHL